MTEPYEVNVGFSIITMIHIGVCMFHVLGESYMTWSHWTVPWNGVLLFKVFATYVISNTHSRYANLVIAIWDLMG